MKRQYKTGRRYSIVENEMGRTEEYEPYKKVLARVKIEGLTTKERATYRRQLIGICKDGVKIAKEQS